MASLLIQTPFPGPDAPVLASLLTIDASNYDAGGQGVAYNDNPGIEAGATNGGRAGSDVEQTVSGDIGWVINGEWLEYTINVARAGSYDLAALMATVRTGVSLQFSFTRAGETTAYVTSGSIGTPVTGDWNAYQPTAARSVALDAGEQVVRVTFTGNGQNLRSFTLTATSTPPSGQAPYPGPDAPVLASLLTIDASNYDAGGQGVAYNDNPGIESGATNGGRVGSDVESTSSGDVGWIANGEWIEYTIDVAQAGTYDLAALMATVNTGRSVVFSFTRAGETTAYVTSGAIGTPNTGNWDSYQSTATRSVALAAGEQVVRATFTGDGQNLRSFTLNATTTPPSGQAPYPGPNAPLLATSLTIDASNYDSGGQGVAYNDNPGIESGATNGGRAGSDVESTSSGDVGWIANGEWIEYTINVAQAGNYDLAALMATVNTGRSVVFSFTRAGETTAYVTSGTIGTPNTGNWDSYQSTATRSVALAAGEQVVRATFTGDGQNLRSFTLAATTTPPSGQAPYPGPNAPVLATSLTIDASNYDSGGQGVAYNDNPGIEPGATNGGRAGSDVESTSSGDVGWIANGEWIEYTINVSQAGNYDLDALMATINTGRSVQFSFTRSGETTAYATSSVLGTPNTGNWDTYQSTSISTVALAAGEQVVRATFNGDGQNLRSFSLTADSHVVNHPPVAVDDVAITEAGQSVDIHVLANDTDVDLDTLLIAAFDQPDHGTVSQNGDVLVYVPDVGYVGHDTFRYWIADGAGGSATADVGVSVVNELGTSFFEPFDTFDTDRWRISDGYSNGSWQSSSWDADQVTVRNGELVITIVPDPNQPGHYLTGEIFTDAFYSYGTYEARLVMADASGTVSAMFVYVGPGILPGEQHDEIDFEFLGNDLYAVHTNYFVDGVSRGSEYEQVGYDASRISVDIAFDWQPDALRWYVDGALVREVLVDGGTPYPTAPGRIFLQLWSVGPSFESWAGAVDSAAIPNEMRVDYIAYTAPGDPAQFADSILG